MTAKKIVANPEQYPIVLVEAARKVKTKGIFLSWVGIGLCGLSIFLTNNIQSNFTTSGVALIYICIIFGSILVWTGLLHHWYYKGFRIIWKDYKQVFLILDKNRKLFSHMEFTEQLRVVRLKLSYLGEKLVEEEAAHSGDLYHEDRVRAKEAFENAYKTFLKAGFIEDVGYGKFIPKT